MAKVRIQSIDALKGTGIILVMMSHMISCKYLTPLYGGVIPLFFISAGITSSTLDINRHSLKRKFARLMIPYFAYSILIVSIYALFSLDTNVFQNILGVIYGRCILFKEGFDRIHLLPRELAPLWFLPSMFVSYVCLALKKRGGVLFFCITIASCFLPILFPWSIETAFVHMVLIYIGYKFKSTFLQAQPWWFIPLVISYCLLSWINKIPNASISYFGVFGVFSFASYWVFGVIETLTALKICQCIERTLLAGILQYIGRNSLRLMCIHMAIYTYFDDFCTMSKTATILISLISIFSLNYAIGILSKYCQSNPIIKTL